MKYDILTINQESLSLEVQNSSIISTRFKNITKKGARIFDNGKIFSNSFVGEVTDEKMISDLKNNLGVGIPYDYDLNSRKSISMIDEKSKSIPMEKMRDSIKESLDLLGDLNKDFVLTGKFNANRNHVILMDDKNIVQEKEVVLREWYYMFKKVGSPNLLDGYFGEEANRDTDIKSTIMKMIPYLKSYKNEIEFKSGKHPVLFLESDQLFRKVSESFNAEKYFLGSALYANKLGKKLFNEKLSLSDIRINEEKALFRPFDMEGTIRDTNELTLIKNGVFENIITDLRNAKKYNLQPTGNGQRSYDSGVSIGLNALTLKAGSKSTSEILAGLSDCVVVFMGHGGDFTDKGDFSTPLQLSYLLKNGEIVGRLPQLTVKTTTDLMLGDNLIDIASDNFFSSNYNPSLFASMEVYLN